MIVDTSAILAILFHESDAGLNFGDCLVYALADAQQEPLLLKGDDFAQTDIEAA